MSPMTVSAVTGQKASAIVDTGSSSFLSDFDKVNPGPVENEEVDPVAEADVYIAYGRDAQAEEILKEAMAKDNARPEIPLKLLEIYAARKDAKAFGPVAEKLHAAISPDSATWLKAAELGRSIDPHNPLYGGDPAHAGSADDLGEDMERTLVLAPGAQVTPEPAARPAAEPLAATGKNPTVAPTLDFDLGFDAVPEEPAAATASASDATNIALVRTGKMDLSLDQNTGGQDAFTLDFDLDLPSDNRAAANEPTKIAAHAGDELLDLSEPAITASRRPEPPMSRSVPDLSSFTDALDQTASVSRPVINLSDHRANAQARAESLEASLGGRRFEPTIALQPVANESAGHGDVVKGSPQWQNVATKLDLARAYLEIGDKEGAQEILKEVVQEGDAEQRLEANRLAAQVA